MLLYKWIMMHNRYSVLQCMFYVLSLTLFKVKFLRTCVHYLSTISQKDFSAGKGRAVILFNPLLPISSTSPPDRKWLWRSWSLSNESSGICSARDKAGESKSISSSHGYPPTNVLSTNIIVHGAVNMETCIMPRCCGQVLAWHSSVF